MVSAKEDPKTLAMQTDADVVAIRQATREQAIALGFSLVEQTKLVTAASELARNAIKFGGGGTFFMEPLHNGRRAGLRLVFEDHGPGIPNIELAMTDGYSTGQGLGLGLGGSKRLMSELEIESKVGQGTRVSIILWKR
jgi:serine/threonine-protein kinase RsbT